MGYYQSDFHITLYTSLSKEPSDYFPDPKLSIRELQKDEFDLFADIYTNGFQMPAFLKRGVAQNNEVPYKDKNWTFYLANVENEAAGIGGLFMKDGIASLAVAATVPEFRNKGIQSALIMQRIFNSQSKGCELVVGQAKFCSVSQNNMEGAGLRIGYIKALWIKK